MSYINGDDRVIVTCIKLPDRMDIVGFSNIEDAIRYAVKDDDKKIVGCNKRVIHYHKVSESKAIFEFDGHVYDIDL